MVERVIERLGREYAYHARLEAVLWEREPLVATHHFQDIANIPAPRSCDIVLVILWSRLGVPLPVDRFRGALSRAPVTGTEWEFEDALAGYREKGMPDLLLYRKRASVTVSLDDDAALDEQRRQKRQVEAFLKRWFFDDAARSFTAAFHEFADAGSFEELVETHLRGLVRRRLEAAAPGGEDAAPPRIRYAGAPFRGLLSFEPEHAAVFFGRARARHELRELVARQAARGTAFVLVLGASGSGKSSLVKAGLLPDLALPGMVGRVALCRHAIVRPSDAGGDPIGALADSLLRPTALPELASLSWTAAALKDLLTASPGQIATALRQGLGAAARGAGLTEHAEARLALIVDQLEELFTQEHLGDADRRACVLALAALARSGLAWVIATMRGDFFDRLGSIAELAELSQGEARYLLAPPTAAEIAQVIAGPAREAGCRYEIGPDGIGLDETIRQAAGKDPGALPLLSFLLDQLWRGRAADGTLTYRSYAALGGLEGALGRRAEEVFRALPAEVQAELPSVLRALVTVGHGEQAVPTARTVRLSQFVPGSPARRLVDAMLGAEARLLVADGDSDGARVRVAHEALLANWDTARRQIDQDRVDLQARARLEQAAARWLAEDRHPDLLLPPGLLLTEAQDLMARRRAELDEPVVAFIDASEAAASRLRSEREAAQQSMRDEQRKRREAEIRVLREAAERHQHEWRLARAGCVTGLILALLIGLALLVLQDIDQRSVDYHATAVMPARVEIDRRIVVIEVDASAPAMRADAAGPDRAFLAGVIDAVREKGAAVLGFGILFDAPGGDDPLLRRALAAFPNPPVVAWSSQRQGINAEQAAALRSLYVGESVLPGLFAVETDDEGVARWVEAGEQGANGQWIDQFAFAVARQAGFDPPRARTWIDYVARHDFYVPVFETHRAHDIADLPHDAFRGKIVLVGLGGDSAFRYDTPLGSYRGRYAASMLPITVQAQVVLQLIEGRFLEQPRRFADHYYLSLGLAALAALLVWLNWRARYVILVPVAYVALWSVVAIASATAVVMMLPLPWNPALVFCLAWSLAQAVRQLVRALRHRRLARETAGQAGTLEQQEAAAAPATAAVQAAAA